MKFFSFISTLALATTSLAHPVEHSAEHGDIHARQNGNPDTRLEGNKGGNVRPRLEIRQLRNTQPEQWNIFMVAMNRWMTSSNNNARFGNIVGADNSYYGISSIHGVPRQNYANVGQCSSCGGSDGYCTHDSVLFPAWHRAYVALFEQEFLKVARSVAASYNNQRYTDAGNALRFPYFDWAARPPNNGPALPTLITDSQVTVQGPNGQQSFRNPLYGYEFIGGQQSGLVYGTLNGYQKTLRYPNSNSPSASNNSPAAAAAFAGARQSLQDQIYQLFTTCKNYLYFSNDDSRDSSARCANSLEQIHNTVHNNAGGLGGNGVSGGHMTYLSTASFDPIFWLHHANVDRIFAMWQAINPSAYGATQPAPHNTWTISTGSNQGPTSGLRPFRRPDADNFWNTNQVRDWTQFGYTYPEFSNSDGSANAISGYVNRLYGPNPSQTAGSSKREAEAEPQLLEALGDILSSNPLKASNGSLYQYVANIKTPRYALGGSYTVYLFNGKPASEDPSTWAAADNLYGPMGLLSQDGMEGSGMNMSILTSGSIPLTTKLTALFDNSLLGSLAELVVAPFLAQNLEWRIAKDGQSIDPATIPGFTVTVVTSSAQPAADANSFPIYSDFIELLGVTRGQAGGANSTQFTSS
ncbi:putative tyrosinase copper-binding domain, di-copper centre-containing domain superfamily, tyosinase [Septoria linicola]|nr:putative tyrosinase copper-binding domain, di-copper centre-containing domain superfamily, tyosinase [Septoria linicola]